MCCSFKALNPSFKFAVQNAFLKFTSSEEVTLKGAGMFSTGDEITIEGIGETQYVAVNPTESAVEFSYWVNGVQCKVVSMNFEAKNIYNLGNLSAMGAVAEVGGVQYASLDKAIAAADAGATVTLMSNVELNESISIASGKEVTLDLAGNTISQEKANTSGYVMINNSGILTIEDSVGGGKITFTELSDGDSSYGWGSYTLRNSGTLTINGGTIENATRAIEHCATPLMLYSGKTTINEGASIISANYRSIQGFSTPEVVINGGTFEGQVWMHETCSKEASLTINGGTFEPRGNDGSSVFLNNTNDIKLSITGGTFKTKVGCDDETKAGVVGAITGGTYTEAAYTGGKTQALIADGYVTYKDGENYVVTTFAAAVAADAEEITVYDEIDLAKVSLDGYTGTIVGGNENAVLNTRNYTGSSNEFYPIQSSTITFKDIDIWFPTEDGDFLLTGIMSRSTLTFNNCDFEGQFTLNGNGTWNFNECDFVSPVEGAYASFVYGATKATFTKCSFSGVDRAAKVYGAGGTLDVVYDNCTFTSTTQNKAAVNVDATYATTTVALNNDCSQTGMGELYALVGTKGKIFIDGVQVAPISYVAKVGDTSYTTLEAAISAANGSTIELLADAGDVTISQACTINAGNYTINITAGEGYILTDNGDGTYTVAVKTYKVYVTAQPKSSAAEWTTVNLYTWDANGNNTWPGQDITANTEVINGYTYHYFEYPAEWNGKTVNCIVNNGANQTPDIELGVVDKDYYVVYSTSVKEVYTEAPAAGSIAEYVAPVEKQMLYLDATFWDPSSARFAAYFFGNGEKWVSMTAVSGKTGIYEVEVPEGYTKVIFCRMNKSTTANNWNNKWNQTGDLIVAGNIGKIFTVKQWDSQTSGWSTYTK